MAIEPSLSPWIVVSKIFVNPSSKKQAPQPMSLARHLGQGNSHQQKKSACTCTYYALLAPVMTGKAFIRKFSVMSVSQVKVLQ